MRRRVWVALVVVALVAAVCFALRGPLWRAGVAAIIDVATGYRVAFDDLAVNGDTIDARGLRVAGATTDLIDAPRVVVHYRWRDLLPGGTRRFGLVSVDATGPRVTLERRADGSFDLPAVSSAPGAPPGIPSAGGPPLVATIRIREGRLAILDPHRTIVRSRRLDLANVNVDATLDSRTRSRYAASARVPGDPAARLRVDGRLDAGGFALHRVRAQSVRFADFVNYFINAPSAQILAGTVRSGDVRFYRLSADYHVAGSAEVTGGSMRVPGVAVAATAMHGRIDFYDNGIATPALGARLGSLDARVQGALFGFDATAPSFELAIAVPDAPLERAKALFNFSAPLPLRGPAAVTTLLEGPAPRPVVATRVVAPAAAYGAFPMTGLDGRAIVYDGAVDVVAAHTRYAGLDVGVGGTIALGAVSTSDLVATIDGPAALVPYAAQIAPRATLHAIARLAGVALAIDARGVAYGAGGGTSLAGYFHVDPLGDGTFGPLAATRDDGGSLGGTFYLDRAESRSGFWLDAHDFPFFSGLRAVPRLPGLPLVAPAFDARLDGALAGFGPPSDFRIAGRVRARDLHVARLALGEVTGLVSGHIGDMRLGAVRARGAWGAFAGTGAYVRERLALQGDYRGSFAGLREFTGDLGARGEVAGPVALLLDPARTVVQARGARVRDGRVRGVPIDALSGTLAVAGSRLRIYAADAEVASGRFAAAGTLATAPARSYARVAGIGVSIGAADAGRLHALAPLDGGGRVATIGRFRNDAATTRYDGGLALGGATFQRIPLALSGDVSLAGTGAHFAATAAVVGDAVGIVDGSLAALDTKRPRYDVDVDLADTPIAPFARALAPSRRDIAGTVAGTFRVTGTSADLALRGTFAIPEGTIDGLDYRDASAQIAIAPSGIGARHGNVTVGSTALAFGGFFRAGDGAFRIDAPHADLADFNDLFDTGDTLGGTGHVVGRFYKRKGVVRTDADIGIAALKYRNFSLGDARANWSSRGTNVSGSLLFGGPSGRLETTGTLDLAAHAPLDKLLLRSRFDGDARLRGLDLGVWLPALGYQLPVTGRVDADATIAGPLRDPDVRTNATLVGGTIGKLPVDKFSIVASSTLSRTTVESAELELPSVSVTGSGRFGLGPKDPLALRLHGRSPSVADLSAHLLGSALPIAGALEADVMVDGTRAAPRVAGGFDLEAAALRGVAIPRAVGEFSIRGRDLVLSDVEANFAAGSLLVAGSLPLQLAPFGFGPARAPIELDLAARNIDLADFAPLFPSGSELKGTLSGKVAVAGTAGLPRLDGAISLANGAAKTPLETVPLGDLRATLAFAGTDVYLRDVHASAGGGTLDASGAATLADLVHPGIDSRYRFEARARGLRLALPAYGSGQLDGTLALAHEPSGTPLLSGTLAMNDGTIPFAALLFSTGSPDGNLDTALPPPRPLASKATDVALDLDVAAQRNVRVRSANVDIGGRGTLHVAGTTAAPQLAGTFDSTGGTLTYFNTVFRVIDGKVTFEPDAGLIPTLDARAETHVIDPDPNTIRNIAGTADVTLDIHGPVTGLNIGLSSDPPYDRQQILGLLLNAPALGASNLFGDTPGQATLYGSNSPGTLPRDIASSRNTLGETTVAQEAFGVANAQFTRTLLAPIESSFAEAVGLTNFNVNVDITGSVGVQARKILGKEVSAVYGTTFGYPYRQTFGFELKPNANTAAQVTVFQTFGSTGITSLNPATLYPTYYNPRIGAAQPSTGSVGFSLSLQRFFK